MPMMAEVGNIDDRDRQTVCTSPPSTVGELLYQHAQKVGFCQLDAERDAITLKIQLAVFEERTTCQLTRAQHGIQKMHNATQQLLQAKEQKPFNDSPKQSCKVFDAENWMSSWADSPSSQSGTDFSKQPSFSSPTIERFGDQGLKDLGAESQMLCKAMGRVSDLSDVVCALSEVSEHLVNAISQGAGSQIWLPMPSGQGAAGMSPTKSDAGMALLNEELRQLHDIVMSHERAISRSCPDNAVEPGLITGLASVREEMQGLAARVGESESAVAEAIAGDLSALQQDVTDLRAGMDCLQADISELGRNLRKGIHEVVPRIATADDNGGVPHHLGCIDVFASSSPSSDFKGESAQPFQPQDQKACWNTGVSVLEQLAAAHADQLADARVTVNAHDVVASSVDRPNTCLRQTPRDTLRTFLKHHEKSHGSRYDAAVSPEIKPAASETTWDDSVLSVPSMVLASNSRGSSISSVTGVGDTSRGRLAWSGYLRAGDLH